MTTLPIPELSLVLLVGPSGSGKSTFARTHFAPTEVLSSDVCRGLVGDDPNDQSATRDAFELLHFLARKRLRRRRLTVVDATNVQRAARASLVALAREEHALPVAIVLNVPAKLCAARNRERSDRSFGPHVVRQQHAQLRKALRSLKREGFARVHVLGSPEAIEGARIERQRLWSDRRDERGPFDVIGDVHGCRSELERLLAELGYARGEDGIFAHPAGRRAVFVGDLVDRGPDSPGVLEIVMGMVERGSAFCVPGNHDVKLARKLRGKDVRVAHGLAETLAQLEGRPAAFAERARRFVEGLVSHLVLDGGELVVAHAGLPETLQGRASRAVRDFALYGETTGETDAFGLPVRVDWARAYRGRATVVHGHTPVRRAEWVNRTLCVDTGCVFGGALTALRWPEKECVSVPAERVWCAPAKPLHAGQAERSGAGLQVEDVLGKRIVETRLDRTVTVREENAAAALEVMSRYGVDPRWLIYLPATMSPAETSAEPGMLEHPREAFAYFRSRGVREVICEEKHMGSRAVLVVCRDERGAAERFGVRDGRRGVVYTRTGRPFFDAPEPEAALLARVAEAASEARLWEELGSSWLCLDAELMPWSEKARGLLQSQYAPVGAAATLGLRAAIEALDACVERGGEAEALRARFAARLTRVREYREAYRPYCWPVERLEDWALAPFHLLASEGGVHTDRDHRWHMETLARLAAAGSSVLRATRHRSVDLDDAASVEAACTWWRALTEAGGEGMVVKPLNWNARGRRGLLQPALKCRGPAYLRLIYGPEYDAPEQLEALRRRKLKTKRRLARKEHALGLEALHRFVEGEPLHRVHECVFGVLALESEPVDPRL